jgi:transposase
MRPHTSRTAMVGHILCLWVYFGSAQPSATCFDAVSCRMVKRIDERQKWAIIDEHSKHGNVAKTARVCNVNEKTVRRWVQQYARDGNVVASKPGGRKKRVSMEAARLAVKLLQDDKFGTAASVATELHRQGMTPGTKPVSKTTLLRAAFQQAGADGDPLEIAMGKPKKQLTAKTMAQRLQFCQANKSRVWKSVMFSDRKKFLFRYPGTKVKSVQYIPKSKGGKHGKKAFIPSKPSVFNVYAAMTKWGLSCVHKVAGSTGSTSSFKNKKGQGARNITSAEYAEVLKKTLLPEGSRMFSEQGLSSWVFQQDNDPSHKKASVEQIGAWNLAHPGNKVTLLANYPPNSPDLNPIENVWALVQRKVDEAGCTAFEEFQKNVIFHLRHFPKEQLTSLYDSMSKRVALCIQAGGGKTKY